MSHMQQKPPCLSGLIHNTNALRVLWIVLSEKYDFTHLRTNKLCQDPLENLFSFVRRACGSNDTPNAEQFGVALKYSMIKRTTKLSADVNCEPDKTVSLIDDSIKLEEFNDPLVDCGDFANCPFEPLNPCESLELDAAELNGLAYIVGYSVSKLNHDYCRDNMNRPYDSDTTSDDELMFCRLKRVLATSNFTLPNTSALEIGLSLKAACQQKFSSFMKQSHKAIKFRLKEYIEYENYKNIICQICFDNISNRILNTLIKAEVTKLQQNLKNSRPKQLKQHTKARRMGMTTRSNHKSNKRKIMSNEPLEVCNSKKNKIKRKQSTSTQNTSAFAAPPSGPTVSALGPSSTPGPSSTAEQLKAIEALEKLVASFPSPVVVRVEEK